MPLQQKVFIQNRLGLHARAAVKLVELTQTFDAKITIENETHKTATAESVMGLLMLESAQGQFVIIHAEGTQAAPALEAVCNLITDKFEEND